MVKIMSYSDTRELRAENKMLKEKLEMTSKQYEALQKQYIHVLNLAKQNADSYEFCLKGLEDRIEEMMNL